MSNPQAGKYGIDVNALAEETGLKLCTVYYRLQCGKTPDEIRATAVKQLGASYDGRVFGLLTVLRELEQRSASGKRMFVCRCTCGNETEAVGADLNSGQKLSCGCYRGTSARERSVRRAGDITGQRFGRLVVTGVSEQTRERSDGRKTRLWVCVCDCGGQALCSTAPLRSGQTTTCGCGQADRGAGLGALSHANAIRVTLLDEPVTVQELAELGGFTRNGARARLKRMSPEDAAFGPRRRR